MITLGFQAMLFWSFSKIVAIQRGCCCPTQPSIACVRTCLWNEGSS
jgi:hypothetical protein